MKKWLFKRLRMPSTWAGFALLLAVIGISRFTFDPHWRLFEYAAAACAIIAVIRDEESGWR